MVVVKVVVAVVVVVAVPVVVEVIVGAVAVVVVAVAVVVAVEEVVGAVVQGSASCKYKSITLKSFPGLMPLTVIYKRRPTLSILFILATAG